MMRFCIVAQTGTWSRLLLLNSAGPKEKCGNRPGLPERLLVLRESGSAAGSG
jgi:hypothetical protein